MRNRHGTWPQRRAAQRRSHDKEVARLLFAGEPRENIADALNMTRQQVQHAEKRVLREKGYFE